MKIITKPQGLVQQINGFEDLEGIDDKVLQWLVDNSIYKRFDEGEAIFSVGQVVNEMQIIVEGEYLLTRNQNGNERIIGTAGTGTITGVLPFSRMKTAGANGKVLKPTFVLEFPKEKFTEMVNVSYELVQNLVAAMSNRIRNFTHIQMQNEKLMSLGKLSAGLAHELNNPASAMVRSADELYRQTHKTPERFKRIMTMQITPEETDEINAILFEKINNWQTLEDLSMLEREEQLDEILDFLEDHEIENGDDIAETFVDFGMNVEEIEKINKILNQRDLESILWWLESTLNLEKLIQEIKESADRIATLVTSVKSYTHMDSGVDVAKIDIRQGIKSTLTMLKHKLKKKNIQVVKEFDTDLPMIKAFPSELNQVWTNLFDNAIDAMDKNGQLTIKIFQHYGCLNVEISDNGSGIPDDIKNSIFDPFFTTKDIGQGTGLGLDVVRRIIDHHKATIEVDSKPGKTTFKLGFKI